MRYNNSSSARGSTFRGQGKFHPTTMSVAMAEAGLIPDCHFVQDGCNGHLRNRNDNLNLRPSAPFSL